MWLWRFERPKAGTIPSPSSWSSSSATRRRPSGGVFSVDVFDSRPGFIAFYAAGGMGLFSAEGGGHRWQRVPPNERRGRVHTSTVTVAVLDPHPPTSFRLNLGDVSIVATRGTGPGGQHRNTTNSCIVATHRPSGLTARVDMRSQHRSRALALEILSAKLSGRAERANAESANRVRQEQIGSGMRGDKIRTYRTQDDRVTDHRTNRTWRLRDWAQGSW